MRTLLATLALALLAGPAHGATTLRLDGIGPLKLGMSRAAAVDTGWLSNRTRGCELAQPRPIVYRLDGRKAPRALRGSVTFEAGKLTNVAIAAGATTKQNVTPGKTTVSQMVSRYRAAGYRASSRFDATFQATFVTVAKGRRQIMSGLAEQRVLNFVSLPVTAVCE